MRNDSKPTLILLPGMLCDEALWEHQTANLADMADIRVMDLTRADSVRGMALATLAESPQRFALAGFSLGGIVAFEIMRLAPERVTRLALLDTTPRPIRPQTVDLWKTIAKTSDSANFNERASQELIQMMHPNHRENPALQQIICNMVKRVGQHGLKNQLQAQINRPDSRETLPQIQIPTLLLSGRDDPACSLEIQLEMLDALPLATLTLLKNCGHFSILEQPKEITSTLQGWLDLGSHGSSLAVGRQ